jgi:photosystem II stability/assembly factor-like uncharacterized protein
LAGGYVQDLATNRFTVFRTNDGGNLWTTISSGYNYYFTCVQFLDSLTGYAGGGAYFIMPEQEYGKCVYKTTNGGANWNPAFAWLAQGGSSVDIKDIHFVNTMTGWACGLDGSIAKTTNGGNNFLFYVTPTTYKKYSVFFINDVTGWVCGENGNIGKSTSGGTNWFTIPITSAVNLNSIHFVNQNTGFICGANGTILKSVNGGLNWTASNTGSTINLTSIFFYNANKGWAAGANIVLGTTNGGSTWTAQFTGSAGLSSVYFCDSVNGWACGGNKIIASKTGGWTGLNNTGTEIPNGCKLFQNYPDPFNPATNIKYQITNTGFISIKIFNILGREIFSFVNEKKAPGIYEIQFSADRFSNNSFPSGVYYYSLFADGVMIDTKKMILLK